MNDLDELTRALDKLELKAAKVALGMVALFPPSRPLGEHTGVEVAQIAENSLVFCDRPARSEVERLFRALREQTCVERDCGWYRTTVALRAENAALREELENAQKSPQERFDPLHTCVICRAAWVDTDNGFDTCRECVRTRL